MNILKILALTIFFTTNMYSMLSLNRAITDKTSLGHALMRHWGNGIQDYDSFQTHTDKKRAIKDTEKEITHAHNKKEAAETGQIICGSLMTVGATFPQFYTLFDFVPDQLVPFTVAPYILLVANTYLTPITLTGFLVATVKRAKWSNTAKELNLRLAQLKKENPQT